jgi:hypothetical protein
MHTFHHRRSPSGSILHFTPAEWRTLLQDGSFLRDPDNSYRPRLLMGLPVAIVPDHRTEFGCPG